MKQHFLLRYKDQKAQKAHKVHKVILDQLDQMVLMETQLIKFG